MPGALSPGPPPKHPSARRRTNATLPTIKLPAEGRQGPPPEWPLDIDMQAKARLQALNDEIDNVSLDAAAGSGMNARAAQRRLFKLREQFEMLEKLVANQTNLEAKLWSEIWRTPHAVMWDKLRWTRQVAHYVRLCIHAEYGDMEAAKEARQVSDRLGLSPLAMLRLRWEITDDGEGEQWTDRAVGRTASRSANRLGLKAVD